MMHRPHPNDSRIAHRSDDHRMGLRGDHYGHLGCPCHVSRSCPDSVPHTSRARRDRACPLLSDRSFLGLRHLHIEGRSGHSRTIWIGSQGGQSRARCGARSLFQRDAEGRSASPSGDPFSCPLPPARLPMDQTVDMATHPAVLAVAMAPASLLANGGSFRHELSAPVRSFLDRQRRSGPQRRRQRPSMVHDWSLGCSRSPRMASKYRRAVCRSRMRPVRQPLRFSPSKGRAIAREIAKYFGDGGEKRRRALGRVGVRQQGAPRHFQRTRENSNRGTKRLDP